MTAEVAVMNRDGIALAADSAATVFINSVPKITSANKLFSLSSKFPVGIMIYGNSSFMDLPWETIIKVYRDTKLPAEGFDTLNEYALHFLKSLSYRNIPIAGYAQATYIQYFSVTILIKIRERVESYWQELGGDDSPKKLPEIANEVVEGFIEFALTNPKNFVPIEVSNHLITKYQENIKEAIPSIFKGIDIKQETESLIFHAIEIALSKLFPSEVGSGIVFAGFGKKDFLPKIRSYIVEGLIKHQKSGRNIELLKYMFDEATSFDDEIEAGIIPFAQTDMVHRFMRGVDPYYVDASDQFLEELCDDFTKKIVSQLKRFPKTEKEAIQKKLEKYNQRLIKEFSENMAEFTKQYFSEPTVEAISRLPKNELASLAEAMVYVTSLKRKVSDDPETVAEPIDVAVISKGDGFIWVKRKHYFKADLNPQFFIKYR